jgi:hypothetical protein
MRLNPTRQAQVNVASHAPLNVLLVLLHVGTHLFDAGRDMVVVFVRAKLTVRIVRNNWQRGMKLVIPSDGEEIAFHSF